MTEHVFLSQIGKICIIEDNGFIIEIELNTSKAITDNKNSLIENTKNQINEFLVGNIKIINVPYKIEGTTFTKKVLNIISNIPYGETISYKELAEKSGYKSAYRACGTVCKNNKLPLIIPCHRVIKANGDIGEYNGGKDLKKTFLSLEFNSNID